VFQSKRGGLSKLTKRKHSKGTVDELVVNPRRVTLEHISVGLDEADAIKTVFT
jgi:hypothetical protein